MIPMTDSSRPRVTAVLGPTNTGKTYLAVERMLGHGSGMIGFPLRLLARENYDRICKLRGAGAVALVTGEEKIVPPQAHYFVCTVESMPLDRTVDFLAIDEVQLAGDAERGHVFTDRLLHARGHEETMLLGSETIRPLLRKLVPEADWIARLRFSTLSYAGPKKLSRLPPRSAVVAFSVAEVYALAEQVRRQRGGTAVVMGALSPRARNAQVELYQSGQVDYLVATDAIGMGLNMDLNHVAFAKLTKFDGRGPRRLTAAEIGQIAGRAGRHMSDGSFGVTGEAEPLAPELVEAVENHRFDPLSALFWRNEALDFRSLDALQRSLEAKPPAPFLIRAREAEDQAALVALARDPEVAALARAPARLRLLWEVCQIPDFRKMLTDAHTRLLTQIYRHLTSPAEKLPTDWVADQIQRIDRVDGDIDALTQRIAHIRTWTYIAHRSDWMDRPGHWQERARAVEDRLSDALHLSLTSRFVDKRHAHLARRLKEGGALDGALTRSGEVVIEGHHVGRMVGFRFEADGGLGGEEARHLHAAARRALLRDMPARLRRFEKAENSDFALRGDGQILWQGEAVARLTPGESPLDPKIEIWASDYLDGTQRERLRQRLSAWFEDHLRTTLTPLIELRQAELSGAARGLAYQIVEALGCLPREAVATQLAALSAADRAALAALGLQIGEASLFLRRLHHGRATRLLAQLWAIHRRRALPTTLQGRPPMLIAKPDWPADFCQAMGYLRIERLAVRADALERLARQAQQLAKQGEFLATTALCATFGCAPGALAALLRALGYRQNGRGPEASFAAPMRKAKPSRAQRKAASPGADPLSPFADLAQLRLKK